jgi:hypothetical protein
MAFNKYIYVGDNPVNTTDPSGLFRLHKTSIAAKIESILLTTMFASKINLPIATIRRFDEDDAVIPGYLKNLDHNGVKKIVNNFISIHDYQRIRKAVEKCNGIQGNNNCDLKGFPIIVWGNDLPEILEHTKEAITATRQSFLSRIKPTWKKFPHNNPQKLYPSGEKYNSAWYDFTNECP